MSYGFDPQPTTLESWASAFGEKKIHFVKVVVESLPTQELENMSKRLADVNEKQRGGEFIKLLKLRKWPQNDGVEKLKPDEVRKIVQQRFEELKNLKDGGNGKIPSEITAFKSGTRKKTCTTP